MECKSRPVAGPYTTSSMQQWSIQTSYTCCNPYRRQGRGRQDTVPCPNQANGEVSPTRVRAKERKANKAPRSACRKDCRGGVPATGRGNRLCFDYNLGSCSLPVTNQACRKGLHLCCFSSVLDIMPSSTARSEPHRLPRSDKQRAHPSTVGRRLAKW